MASGKPDIEDGWYKTAHEFGAAESVADFAKSERVVLELAKAQVFGPARANDAYIDQSTLATRYGYKRQFINVGVTGLVKAGILVAKGDDWYRLNKYYRTWKFRDGTAYPNGSRFTDLELREIAKAPDVAMDFRRESPQSSPSVVNQPVDKASTNQLTEAPALSTKELTGRQLDSCQVVNQPVDETAPLNRRETRRKKDSDTHEGATVPFIPTDSPPPPTSRGDDDAAQFDQAVAMLVGDATAEVIGLRLSRNSLTTDIRAIEGWKFLAGARTLLSAKVDVSKRGNWNYYLGCVRGATKDDLTPAKPKSPFTLPAAGAPNLYRRRARA